MVQRPPLIPLSHPSVSLGEEKHIKFSASSAEGGVGWVECVGHGIRVRPEKSEGRKLT